MIIEDFSEAFTKFCVGFNKEVTDERIQVYFDSLRYYEPGEIAKAFAESTAEDEYFPNVGQLVGRIKTHRKPKPIECEYCEGSGFEIVYSTFEIVGNTHRCGPPVTREQYEADPVNHRMFAARCRCRPRPLPQPTQKPKELNAKFAIKALSLCLTFM